MQRLPGHRLLRLHRLHTVILDHQQRHRQLRHPHHSLLDPPILPLHGPLPHVSLQLSPHLHSYLLFPHLVSILPWFLLILPLLPSCSRPIGLEVVSPLNMLIVLR